MKQYNKEINRLVWFSRFKRVFVSFVVLIALLIVVFVFVEPSGKEIDGVIVGVTRSQTTLSSGTVLVVDIGESSNVMLPVPSVSIPKKGQKVRLIVMNTIIPGYKRYKFLGYEIKGRDKK